MQTWLWVVETATSLQAHSPHPHPTQTLITVTSHQRGECWQTFNISHSTHTLLGDWELAWLHPQPSHTRDACL